MNKGSMVVLVAGLAFIVGSVAGWVAARSSTVDRRAHRLTTSVILTDPNGKQIGQLSEGIPVITTEKLDPNADLGWWGYVPVYFGTNDEAALVVSAESLAVKDDASLLIRALPPDQLPTIQR